MNPAVLYVEDDAQSRMVMEMLLTNRMKLEHVTILENSCDFVGRLTALKPPPDVIFPTLPIPTAELQPR